MEQITNWLKQQISNPQIVFLSVFLVCILLVVLYAGHMLAPALAGIVIAYLLDGIIKFMSKAKLPRTFSVLFVFTCFMMFLLLIIFGLIPILYNQFTDMVQQIPNIVSSGQAAVLALPERYPDLFSVQQANEMLAVIRTDLTDLGQKIVTNSISGAASIITVMIYVVLLPILIFFFLRDKNRIIDWFSEYLPSNNQLAVQVWKEVDVQIGNYIRGKFWEILIVWAATFLVFIYLDFQYAMLLSVLVGLSVLIPYVGAAIVTIPVVIIAWFQWGWGSDFATLVVAYLVVQALDGNLLVPLLFSEVVNLHPVAIIIAVLFFGGLWGVWGIFFAIPLATVVQAILRAWPKADDVASST